MDRLPESYRLEHDNYQEVIQQGISQALEHIQEQYENSPNVENNLDYHNTEHTLGVIHRVATILDTIKAAAPDTVSNNDIALGMLIAAYHDTVQNWYEVATDSAKKRQRHIGYNEWDSALLLQEFMQQATIFSPGDIELGRESIMATVPGWDAAAGTVIQPNLTGDSSLMARVLALADLNAAGMEGPTAIFHDSATIFREDNLDMKLAMQQAVSLSSEQKEAYRQRILSWLGTQSDFVAGRQRRLDAELRGLPEAAVLSVKNLFNRFDEAIETMRCEVVRRQSLSFEDLAATMGY